MALMVLLYHTRRAGTRASCEAAAVRRSSIPARLSPGRGRNGVERQSRDDREDRDMTERQTAPALTLQHTMMSEHEARQLLDGHRISLGVRTMDPKAQIVGEFVKSIRAPGYYPPLPELRQQLKTMVTLMDEPAPSLARIEDLSIPGPAGPIGAR